MTPESLAVYNEFKEELDMDNVIYDKEEDAIRASLKETIEISKEDYYSLLQIAQWSKALEEAGVDNWDGIDEAYNIFGGGLTEDEI